MTDVHGHVAAGYERVAEVLESQVAADGTGAGVAAWVEGAAVVDVWTGDAAEGRPWAEDTLCQMWSVGKGLLSVVALVLADRGLLDVDAPVGAYWPEFADGGPGKADAPVHSILEHSVGLPYADGYEHVVNLDEPAGWLQGERIVDLLGRAPLIWSPGQRHGYHSVTMGWLFAEVVRRVTGRRFGDVFRSELAQPLGLDLWAGLPAVHHRRVATMVPPPGWSVSDVAELTGPATVAGKIMFVGPALSFHDAVRDTMNSAEFRSSETPAIGMIGDARSVARLYGLLALDARDDGRRVASKAAIERHVSERYRGKDDLLGPDLRIALGFQLPGESAPYSPNAGAFGHAGLSGAHGFVDPDAALGFGYVPSAMGGAFKLDRRAKALIDAVYASLPDPGRRGRPNGAPGG